MSKIRKIVIIIQILALMVMTSCSNNDNKKIIEDSTYVEIDSIDYGLEMTEITIEIPGLEYERTYLYMADNQANFDNTIEDLGWFGSSTNRVFCDENGISAADNIDNWINFANDSKVDYMLMGGDIIDFYSQENIDILKSELSKLEVPYLYTYGNHDSYVPWENKFDDDAEDFNELFHYGNREIQVIDEGDYYIVAVRNYSVDGTAQISDIALNEFLKVYEQQKPIILICHVPIYTAYTNGLYETTVNAFGHIFMKYDAGEFGTVDAALLMGDNCGYELTDASKKFLDLVLSETSPVVAVFSGHIHQEWEGYIAEDIYEYVGHGAYSNRGALIHIIGDNR